MVIFQKGEDAFKHPRLTIDSANRGPQIDSIPGRAQTASGKMIEGSSTLNDQGKGVGGPKVHLNFLSCGTVLGWSLLVQGGRHLGDLGDRKACLSLLPGHSTTGLRVIQQGHLGRYSLLAKGSQETL